MLQQLPEYTQCYLRLACIAQLCGHAQEAIDWIQKALQHSPDSPDALCLLGTSLAPADFMFAQFEQPRCCLLSCCADVAAELQKSRRNVEAQIRHWWCRHHAADEERLGGGIQGV